MKAWLTRSIFNMRHYYLFVSSSTTTTLRSSEIPLSVPNNNIHLFMFCALKYLRRVELEKNRKSYDMVQGGDRLQTTSRRQTCPPYLIYL